jgi:hypothetical protein
MNTRSRLTTLGCWLGLGLSAGLIASGCSVQASGSLKVGEDDWHRAGRRGATGGSAGQGTGGSSTTGGSTTTGGTGGTGASGGSGGTSASSSGSGGSAGSAGGSSGTTASAGKGGSGAKGGSTGSGGAPAPIDGYKPGADCGLTDPAFCDDFEAAPATTITRAGELDASKWSGARMEPELPTAPDHAFEINTAPVSNCRAGLADKVLADQDALICDATSTIGSHHLLAAVAAQNYGINTYRVRKPFDFAGRTGKIAADAEMYVESTLLGWTSLELSQDPTPTPNVFDCSERGPYMANGVAFEFEPCDLSEGTGIAVKVLQYANHVETLVKPSGTRGCLKPAQGELNHIEISISDSNLAISASDASPDGATFPNFRQVWSGPFTVGFTRGYVSVSTHNHATVKYSTPPDWKRDGGILYSWNAAWDNVGFDGPSVDTTEYSAPDSLMATSGGGVSIGYVLPGTVTIDGVKTSGMKHAKLVFSSWYPNGTFANYHLKYSVNGGTAHDKPLSAAEQTEMKTTGCQTQLQGALNQTADVDISELVDGKNTIDFSSSGVSGGGYPPAVANVDLILSAD